MKKLIAMGTRKPGADTLGAPAFWVYQDGDRFTEMRLDGTEHPIFHWVPDGASEADRISDLLACMEQDTRWTIHPSPLLLDSGTDGDEWDPAEVSRAQARLCRRMAVNLLAEAYLHDLDASGGPQGDNPAPLTREGMLEQIGWMIGKNLYRWR